jgi:hypothetical protein
MPLVTINSRKNKPANNQPTHQQKSKYSINSKYLDQNITLLTKLPHPSARKRKNNCFKNLSKLSFFLFCFVFFTKITRSNSWECSEGLKVEWRHCLGINIPQIKSLKTQKYHKHTKLVYELENRILLLLFIFSNK